MLNYTCNDLYLIETVSIGVTELPYISNVNSISNRKCHLTDYYIDIISCLKSLIKIFLQFTVAPHMVQTSFVRGFFGRTIRGRKIQGIYLYFCLYLLGLVLSLVRAAAMTKGHTQKLSAESEHNLHRCSQQEWRRQVRLGQDSLAIYLSSCILNKHGRKITESYIFDTTNINSLVTAHPPTRLSPRSQWEIFSFN